jgi:tetratricopeptide (TPR) repeat protein
MKLTVIVTIVIAYFFSQIDTYKEAEKLYDNKQYKASIEICTKEINKLNLKDSLFTKFISLRENSYRELKDYSLGINDCLILIKIHPTEISYYLELSYLYGNEGEYDKCFAILKKGLELDPNNIYLLNNFSYYSNYVGNWEDGLAFANKGLALTTDAYWKGVLFNNRGYSNIGLKKYELALNDINEAIKLNPDNSFAYCYRALANIRLKHFETVCLDLNKSKSLGSEELSADLIKQYCKN